jgi:hypothetical protein
MVKINIPITPNAISWTLKWIYLEYFKVHEIERAVFCPIKL